MTTVSEVMTRGVRSLAPTDNVLLAAQAMQELNVGAIPVCDGDRLVGMVTDRDIVLRSVAQERNAGTTQLKDVMSTDVQSTREGESIDDVLQQMSRAQIRRLPVLDGDQRLVGILSLGDVAVKEGGEALDVAASLSGISAPAQPDRSGQSQASGPAG
ncbi:CBS domain-containing protein [Acidovorax sp. Root219]|uniref:CBS domain-containing protein n=1 Tax=Acidovorax sp. Root219 TaxID=1736493 RepID=UPI000708C552|nr:CBS domain-containing protein [Acidovorax sp. Root219]KRC17073.1 histidine kinase [Acidovorax sp. Root219]